MIEILPDFPDEVLAVRASGRLSASDYRETLVPEVRRRVEQHGTLRMLYQLGPQFDGMTAGAMWSDATLGIRHWSDFGRIAIVTDSDWIGNSARLFGPFFPHAVKVYPNAEFEVARQWILQHTADEPQHERAH
ncbi:MAG: STAS/SEC14 domain-containing protein [Usitatibacter sp.]